MMKRFLTVLLLGALLCFPACTDIREDPTDTGTIESAAGTDAPETESGTETERDPAVTDREYTKRY